MVYFMQSVDGGPIKIGCSINLQQRREKLEQEYGTPLAVLATIDGGRAEEQAIHARFSHLRLGRSEQFRPGSDLLAFIGRPLLVGPNPDAVEAMPSLVKPMAIQIRGSVEWKAWAERMAKHDGRALAGLVDRALQMYGRQIGFNEEAPPR